MAGADSVDAEPAYSVSVLQEVQHVALATALNAYISSNRSTGAHNESMLSVCTAYNKN